MDLAPAISRVAGTTGYNAVRQAFGGKRYGSFAEITDDVGPWDKRCPRPLPETAHRDCGDVRLSAHHQQWAIQRLQALPQHAAVE